MSALAESAMDVDPSLEAGEPSSSTTSSPTATFNMPPASVSPSAARTEHSNAKHASSSASTLTMSKRQQAAHRARMLALSKQLKTRLQYAAFKVEHGWSKQSLSEVENLFYKHRRASGSGTSPAAVAGASSSSKYAAGRADAGGNARAHTTTGHIGPIPSTPTRSSTTQPRTRPSASKGHMTGETLGGLVTPPMSGNTLPSAGGRDRYKDMLSHTTPSFASGLSSTTHAPNPPRHSPTLPMGSNVNGGHHSNSKKSYADFWSKIGGESTTASSATEGDKSSSGKATVT